MSRTDLSAEDILAVLNRHHVEYLVIGAFAAIAQGAPLGATYDVNVTPGRDADNLVRLSATPTDLDARIRVDDLEEGLAFAHNRLSLAGMAMLNLTCPSGDFDIVFAPAGAPSGYDELVGTQWSSGWESSRWPQPGSRTCSARRKRPSVTKMSGPHWF